MPIGKPLHLRLFLEGLEVPVIGAQVSMNTNAPASAAIQVIPLDSVMDLKPRTMVHLFYYDPYTSRVTGEKGIYRLLFMGEAVSYSFVQTPMSRAAILQCLDFSSYWDAARATAIEYGPWGNVFTHDIIDGGDSSQFDDIMNQQAQRLLSWLGQSPLTPGLSHIGGLAGGIIRMMEAMGGVPGHHKGINDFFTVAQLRCRILEQITAEENDNTARNLLASKVLHEWLKTGIQNASLNVSFRDMMLMLFQYIYYESVPISTPYFTDSKRGSNEYVEGGISKLSSGSLGSKASSTLTDVATTLGRYTSEKTWTKVVASIRDYALKKCEEVKKSLSTLKIAAKDSSSDLKVIDTSLTSAINKLKSLGANSTGVGTQLAVCRSHVVNALTTLNKSSQGVKNPGYYKSTSSTQRCRTQIIRPDVWFAVPPNCNVIFPEHYTQLSYDRAWITEVTRSLVLVNIGILPDTPDARLLARRILAPNISKGTAKLVTETGEQSYRILMKHEYHTGIVPREEWLPDTHAVGGEGGDVAAMDGAKIDWSQKMALYHFFKYRFAPRQAAVSGRFNPYVVCGFPSVIIRRPIYALDGMEDYTEQQLLDWLGTRPELYKEIPYQLVGMIAGVTHQVGQEGGMTSISMHSVRRHSGTDDEFLGLVAGLDQLKVEQTVPVSFTFADVLASKDKKLLKFLSDITPQTSTAKPAKKVTVKKVEEKQVANGTMAVSTESEVQPLFPPPKYTRWGTIRGVEELGTRSVLVPDPGGGRKSGDEGSLPGSKIVGVRVIAAKGETDATVVYQKKRYFKTCVVYLSVKITAPGSLPVEEMLRPDWLSPAYKNKNVGEQIYAKFFGCDSIVDSLSVTGALGDANVQGMDVTSPPLPATDNGDTLVAEVKADAARKQSLSIERAINALAFIYGQVKKNPNLNADDYVEQVTWRPIASMSDIFGDPNLRFDSEGMPLPGDSEGIAVDLKVGFHTTSVHPDVVKLKNLKGLLRDPTNPAIPRINSVGKDEPIVTTYDVRWEKQDRVTEYVSALKRTQGFLG